MGWRLIPSWAKDTSAAAKMINARSETASTKPAFRECAEIPQVLDHGRRLLPAVSDGKAKQPYCFGINEGALFAFPGIWEGCKRQDSRDRLDNDNGN